MIQSSPASFGRVTAASNELFAQPRASQMRSRLREIGLRPTRTRVALGSILFGKGDRHVTAEMLFEEARQISVSVSLATVYNTLHQFTEVGLLRQVAIESFEVIF